jgi:hypothetical protein
VGTKWARDRMNNVGRKEVGGSLDRNFSKAEMAEYMGCFISIFGLSILKLYH